MHFLKIGLLTLPLLFTSCKSKKVSEASVAESNKTTLVIDLISIGSGIDRNAFKAIEDQVNTHVAKSECKMESTLIPWGREGEKQFCINAEKTACFDEFVETLKGQYAGNKRVRIQVGASCRK